MCHTVSPSLHKLRLNPLPGRAEWQFHVFSPESWIPVGTIMVPFPLVIFSLQQWKLRATSLPILPSSFFLLPPLFPRLTHESVNTEALFAAAVVSLSRKAKPSQPISLCLASTRVSGLPLWLTGRDKRAAKRQSHGDWCCLRLMYPPNTNGRILWPQAVLSLHCTVVSVPWLLSVSLVPSAGVVAALVTCKNQRKFNFQPYEGWVAPTGTDIKQIHHSLP